LVGFGSFWLIFSYFRVLVQSECKFIIFFTQVFIHNPHKRLNLVGGRVEVAQSSNDINLLNINQQVSALCCGSLDDSERDLLFIGTPTNLLAYDVENNSDLFYQEVNIHIPVL